MAEELPAGERRRMWEAASLGTQFAVTMVACGVAGNWLDRRRGEGVGWTIVGLFVGLTLGFYELWKFARREEKSWRKDGKGDDAPK
jgi:hypothetical protein